MAQLHWRACTPPSEFSRWALQGHPFVGDARSLVDTDEVSKDVVMQGHRWIVLKECVPAEMKVQNSMWGNAYQNENQGTHEIEILQNVIASAQALQKVQVKVNHSELIAKTQKYTTQKIPVNSLMIISDFPGVPHQKQIGASGRDC